MKIEEMGKKSDPIIESIVQFVRDEYPADIAIIGVYGSYARNTQHEKSDIDIFFTPATPRGYEASRQFIIGGIGYDFWPISWERMESALANFSRIVTVISECIIVYYRSSEDLKKITEYKRRIDDMLGESNSLNMMDKALDLLKESGATVIDMHSQSRPLNILKQRFLDQLMSALSAANRKLFTSCWTRDLDRLSGFPLLPSGFIRDVDTLIDSRTDRAFCIAAEMLLKTREVIEKARSAASSLPDWKESFAGFYEELLSTTNKIKNACSTGDKYTAFISAMHFQDITNGILSSLLGVPSDGYSAIKEFGLPVLSDSFDPEKLEEFSSLLQTFDNALRKLITDKGISINYLSSNSELDSWIRK